MYTLLQRHIASDTGMRLHLVHVYKVIFAVFSLQMLMSSNRLGRISSWTTHRRLLCNGKRLSLGDQ